jgi:[NiFe] hydrogenase diaphorase moiety large subunit
MSLPPIQSTEMSNSNLQRSDLLKTFWRFQNEHGFIRDEDIEYCSDALSISKIELDGVASFFHFFHRQPCGKFTIYLNHSIIARMQGYDRIKEAFERETGAPLNGVDPSGQFGLYETPCIGLSDQEPSALINFHPFTNLHGLKVRSIVAKLRQGIPVENLCDSVVDHIRYVPPDDRAILFRDYTPGHAIAKMKTMSAAEVIEFIKQSKLCGLGGAFYPTGAKWKSCRDQSESTKYIVCNADEGEPGTFKDRVLMNRLPGLVLEGMIVAGYAVGSREGIIYLRAEYSWLRDKIESTINQFRKMNLLGHNVGGISGFDFEIRLELGAGSYVCGEETAMLNSMEGKRGEPRTRQFYPTQRGFMNKPTVVNNVETFCVASRILELGLEKYFASGTSTCPGTVLLSISGDCRKPGIYEIEWGTTAEAVLELCEAEQPYYIQISGPSGYCIRKSEANRSIAIDDLRCGGSFMIFNETRDVLKILQSFTEFFKHESCGVCTPCRAGNFIIDRQLKKIAMKLARPSDLDSIQSWGKIMNMTSRCGLGKTATRTLCTAIEKFPEVFSAQICNESEDAFNRGFDLQAAVSEYDRFSR